MGFIDLASFRTNAVVGITRIRFQAEDRALIIFLHSELTGKHRYVGSAFGFQTKHKLLREARHNMCQTVRGVRRYSLERNEAIRVVEPMLTAKNMESIMEGTFGHSASENYNCTYIIFHNPIFDIFVWLFSAHLFQWSIESTFTIHVLSILSRLVFPRYTPRCGGLIVFHRFSFCGTKALKSQ